MAKGRRLQSSARNDRLLGLSSYYDHARHGGDTSDFVEEDVWSLVADVADHDGYGGEWIPRATAEIGMSREPRHPHRHQQAGGLSLAFEDQETTSSGRIIINNFAANNGGGPRAGSHVASSAPVNVPDWSKILRVNSGELMRDADEDEDGRVGDSGMEPPHEYLARSRKVDSGSVFEGMGRTLKGRDLNRVRDAVWSKTGFEG